jgi:AraC family transcriptional regulator of adaptative response / DNA-3-methyladenine glycosylase II
MLAFFSKRCISAIEFIDTDAAQPCLGRTFSIESGGKLHAGWLLASFDEARSRLVLRVSDSLREVLPLVIRRVRTTFDLDADPTAINGVLHDAFPEGDGLRVPGALDGYELAVRAVLGQQITVAAARTLAQRMVDRFGEPVETPWPKLTRLFPAPAVLAAASGDALGQLGIVKQRQAAIVGIAQAVARQAPAAAQRRRRERHDGHAERIARHRRLDRAVHRDARPALARRLSGGRRGAAQGPGRAGHEEPGARSRSGLGAWKPWRSYAVIRAWSGTLERPG